MKNYLFASVALATMLGVSAASANTLSATSGDVFGSNGRSSVTITSAPNPGTFTAGGFQLLNDGVDPNTYWCLDLEHWLALPGVYNATSTPFASTFTFSAAQIAAIENLFEVGYSTLILGDNTQSAGFQLALWELVYESDTGPYGLGGGAFTAAAGSVASFANSLLASLGGPITKDYDVTFWDAVENGAYGQNLVSVLPVPLPAAGWMLGLGLLGLFGLSRRRGSKVAV